ncbi:MAG TPA: Trp biosynthesis-associated membrane protein [Mycobacteriales bacterium]|nr:Trp biosynthesis-associated membrane protein [Mycobacteriales bacterium]
MKGLLRSVALVAVGGVLILIASGREWSHTTVQIPAAAATHVAVTGNAVEPSLSALAIALLALAAGLIAARGVLRRIVGVVIVVIGATAVGVAVAGRGAVSSALTSHEVGGLAIPAHGSANGWWVVAALGAVLAVIAGALAAVRSGGWAAMGRKYDAPDPARPVVAKGDPSDTAWDALDRGEDPTA